MTDKKNADQTFEQVLGRLEEIVALLERGESLDLEASLSLFQEGVGLVKQGSRKLNDVERRVERLMRDVDEGAEPLTEAFDPDPETP